MQLVQASSRISSAIALLGVDEEFIVPDQMFDAPAASPRVCVCFAL